MLAALVRLLPKASQNASRMGIHRGWGIGHPVSIGHLRSVTDRPINGTHVLLLSCLHGLPPCAGNLRRQLRETSSKRFDPASKDRGTDSKQGQEVNAQPVSPCAAPTAGHPGFTAQLRAGHRAAQR